nr:hypothetical protein [Tanacetum cinerariifolium]
EDGDDDNVKDDYDDSDENVDDDDEMIKLDNNEEDINLDERILTLAFHEVEDEEDYDDPYGDFNKSTYEATSSLTEFELNKVLFDKMNDSESYRSAPEHKELYD